MKHRLFFWICLTILLALSLSACQPAQVTPSPAAASGAAPASGAAAAASAAQARIEPQAYVDLAFSVPGRVAEVLVKEGDTLSAGQPIARLEGREQRQADLARAGQDLTAAQQGLLSAQKDLEDLNSNAALNMANADLAVVNAQKTYDEAVKNRKVKDLRRCSQDTIDLYAQILDDAKQRLKDLQNNTDSRSVNDLRRITAAQSEVDTAGANYIYCIRYTDEELARSAAEINVAEAALNQAKARQDLLKQGNGVDPLELARLNSAVSAAQAGLAAAKTAQTSAQASLDALELRAPIAGTLASLNLKVGQFIPGGQSAATLADFTGWLAKTEDLTELQVVGIRPGQEASLVLDALPGQSVSGKVLSVSQRSVVSRGDTTYTVTVQLASLPADARWGMGGQLTLQSGK